MYCVPYLRCRIVALVVDEVTAKYVGYVKVIKLNTDHNSTVASYYGIRNIHQVPFDKSLIHS